jgi:hypothetical protein
VPSTSGATCRRASSGSGRGAASQTHRLASLGIPNHVTLFVLHTFIHSFYHSLFFLFLFSLTARCLDELEKHKFDVQSPGVKQFVGNAERPKIELKRKDSEVKYLCYG